MPVIPKLLILIHTEEEFDWDKPFSRENRNVSHVNQLWKYQEMFSHFGASVAYALTYPMTENAHAVDFFKEINLKFKNTYIGMHCHPWVTPPYREEVNNVNSYPGNLPYQLEFDKLENLYQMIHKNIGNKPVFYLAGRYGIGQNTYQHLNKLNIKVDLSPVPFYDYSQQDGPDFSNYTTRISEAEGVIIIPHSSGYSGWLSKGGEKPAILFYKKLVNLRFTSLLSIMGGFDQILLTPEGFSLNQMKALTKKLVKSGHETLVLSFHSPSIVSGNTPFVTSKIDEQCFFKKLEQYMKFYQDELRGNYLSLAI